MSGGVSSEPMNFASPAGMIDTLNDAVKMRIEIGANAFGASGDEIAREEFLLVEGVDREEITWPYFVLNVTILLVRNWDAKVLKDYFWKIFYRPKACIEHNNPQI